MKLIISRIVIEFNKIFSGVKRVGDSLRLEGKRMSELDVFNASRLGGKTASSLEVKSAETSSKTELIKRFNSSGDPIVNAQGEATYGKECDLSVSNARTLMGVSPENLDVKSASVLRLGAPGSQIVNVSDLIVNVAARRVKDSELLGGRKEEFLNVLSAQSAGTAAKLGTKIESELSVLHAASASKLVSTDVGNPLRSESELMVKRAEFLKYADRDLNVFELTKHILEHDSAKNIYVNLSAASNTLTTANGNKSFADIFNLIKTDSNSEAYKTSRLITGTAPNTTVLTADEYKTWIIGHTEFSAKVNNLNAATADRAERIGSGTNNYDISELEDRIVKTLVADNASNAYKLQNKTVDEIVGITRTRILSDPSNSSYGLTSTEVSNFFGHNFVKAAVKAIKVDASVNADTIGTKTLADIYSAVKTNGDVSSSKWIYADPNNASGGLKSYANIISDINGAITGLVNGATTDYDTLKKIETVVKNNKTSLELSISNNVATLVSADSTLQTNINSEKTRIDTILFGADTDKNSFSKIKTYIGSLTGDLSTSTTTLDQGITKNIVNILNAHDADISTFKNTTSGKLASDISKIEISVGLATDGNLPTISGRNYVNNSSTVLDGIFKLDTALKAEESSRISAVSGEILRATGVEGTLSSLITANKTNLVNAINEIATKLNTETTTRTTDITTINNNITTLTTTTGTLSEGINTLTTSISSETTRAKNVEGILTSLSTSDKTNLVAAINENYASLASEISRASTSENTLSTSITNLSSQLSTEVSERKTEDTRLSGYIDTINVKLNKIGNLDSLTTADKTNLVSAINEVKAGVSTGISSAITTLVDPKLLTLETSLTTATNVEKDRITKIVSGIGFANIDSTGSIEITNTTYLNESHNIKDALYVLDENIRSKTSTLNSRSDAIVTQLNNIVGLNGTADAYDDIRNVSASYIATATSMLDADNKLDYQIKLNSDSIGAMNDLLNDVIIKLDGIEVGATADQTKDDIDVLGINALTVNGFTVEASVPVNAVFTDTTYELSTVYYKEYTITSDDVSSSKLTYEILDIDGVSVTTDITKNITVYIDGKKVRNSKFTVIYTSNSKNEIQFTDTTYLNAGSVIEVERLVLSVV